MTCTCSIGCGTCPSLETSPSLFLGVPLTVVRFLGLLSTMKGVSSLLVALDPRAFAHEVSVIFGNLRVDSSAYSSRVLDDGDDDDD